MAEQLSPGATPGTRSAGNPSAAPSAANPYAAPQAAVEDASTGPAELATRGSRLAASVVDGLIFGGIGILAALMMPAMGRGGMIAVGAIVLIGFLVVVGVNLRLLARYGQTIGKRLLNIRITRVDGSEASLSRIIFLRSLPQWIVSSIPYVGFLSLVDVLFIFGAEQRCIHDRIADTIVVKA